MTKQKVKVVFNDRGNWNFPMFNCKQKVKVPSGDHLVEASVVSQIAIINDAKSTIEWEYRVKPKNGIMTDPVFAEKDVAAV